MAELLLIVAGVIFAYWLWGTTRPGGVAGKPMVFTGVTGGLWILGVAVVIALIALLA